MLMCSIITNDTYILTFIDTDLTAAGVHHYHVDHSDYPQSPGWILGGQVVLDALSGGS